MLVTASKPERCHFVSAVQAAREATLSNAPPHPLMLSHWSIGHEKRDSILVTPLQKDRFKEVRAVHPTNTALAAVEVQEVKSRKVRSGRLNVCHVRQLLK